MDQGEPAPTQGNGNTDGWSDTRLRRVASTACAEVERQPVSAVDGRLWSLLPSSAQATDIEIPERSSWPAIQSTFSVLDPRELDARGTVRTVGLTVARWERGEIVPDRLTREVVLARLRDALERREEAGA